MSLVQGFQALRLWEGHFSVWLHVFLLPKLSVHCALWPDTETATGLTGSPHTCLPKSSVFPQNQSICCCFSVNCHT